MALGVALVPVAGRGLLGGRGEGDGGRYQGAGEAEGVDGLGVGDDAGRDRVGSRGDAQGGQQEVVVDHSWSFIRDRRRFRQRMRVGPMLPMGMSSRRDSWA
ncbi:hypothetical protein Sme01_37990 [Sphaerisporangium melleum]|nr:hypothetical protein Sme01_37990 [Sphaerisporangium melleum]